jgi:hypothetical protein
VWFASFEVEDAPQPAAEGFDAGHAYHNPVRFGNERLNKNRGMWL